MDTNHYLDLFNKGFDLIDQTPFQQQTLELKVGVWLNSVVLKIQGKAWVNQSPETKPFSESVFFSVWVNDDTIASGKVFYNIHALKMRELKGYRIQSREFADAFRREFKTYEEMWPNVSTAFGPLTLMEGHLPLNDATLPNEIVVLTEKFLPLAKITDKLLAERKK
ncbi:hypothetical protein HQ865_04535 [Mucilaginibacter mali]|uniref:Uncharacterized protein n=1 Tax=Mucilaginibacter mali TaxID=2740462 RepID=A0A7D4PSF3_9SPHI|nr:hypothetical protein [Mucilaginibacter mali]QKJ29048.1 hypothetical protein HQ865_04535 [Mucilaginibacter mali]